MEQQPQFDMDQRDEQITQLKAELERAYQVIDQLRLEISQLQNPGGQFSILLKNKVSISAQGNQHYKQKPEISKRLFNKLSTLRFVAIVTTVASTLTFVGVVVANVITNYLAEQSTKASVNLSQSFNLPSVSPVLPLPAWAIAKSLPIPSRQAGQGNSVFTYNLKTPPNFKPSRELQAIVNELVNLTLVRGLPTKPLSITLINAKTGENAGYQQDKLRYPASVVKMFWMEILYSQIESGLWAKEVDFIPYIAKMIQESDNEAASFIIDKITDTQSALDLNDEQLKIWINKRQQLNRFFQEAGYKDINISQKTFPIPYLKLTEPKGSDLEIRRDSTKPEQPIRNKITTEQAARLLYETCYVKQAISPKASQKMCEWLKRDLNPKAWKKQPLILDEFNPIRAFFGESLSNTDVELYSKAGWTSNSRQEAALVATRDGETIYILVIFADNSEYAKDEKIFPKMSRLVYRRMTTRSSLR